MQVGREVGRQIILEHEMTVYVTIHELSFNSGYNRNMPENKRITFVNWPVPASTRVNRVTHCLATQVRPFSRIRSSDGHIRAASLR